MAACAVLQGAVVLLGVAFLPLLVRLAVINWRELADEIRRGCKK